MSTISSPLKALSLSLKALIINLKQAVVGKEQVLVAVHHSPITMAAEEEEELSANGNDVDADAESEFLSAREFAQAIGIAQNVIFIDEVQNTVLSTLGEQACKSCSAFSSLPNSFPKLDLNIFLPLGQEYLTHSRSLPYTISTSATGYPLDEPKTSTFRSRSISLSSSNTLFDRSHDDREIDDFEIRKAKKGRFDLTFERSSHFFAKSPRKRSVSRFSLVYEL
jgi:hypothetical protein